MAGVIIASPENSADPATPSRNAIIVRCPSARWASAFRDRIPPSPLLSACIRNRTYFAVTTIRSAQMMRETTPTTSVRPQRGLLQLAERSLQRVERACSDVAENDADRAERKNPEAARRMVAWRGFGLRRRSAEQPPSRRVGHPEQPQGRQRQPAPFKRRVSILSRAPAQRRAASVFRPRRSGSSDRAVRILPPHARRADQPRRRSTSGLSMFGTWPAAE